MCSDKLDNDNDGVTDCDDQDCWPLEMCRVNEISSAQCQDGKDNDRDGKTDCADEGCRDFVFCANADAAQPDTSHDAGPPRPDTGPTDAPADSQPSDAPQDGQTVTDAAVDVPTPDLQAPGCNQHCDCQQGSFCYKGTCLQDPKMDVYCCAKPGCPPGHWCMTLVGDKERCPEDPSYTCQTACDCGPAHCCKSGVCVKDTADPWLPGGTAINGLKCDIGMDPTYCCADAACHAGRFAYGDQVNFFRCFDSSKNQADNGCGGQSCLGTACDCQAGEVCVDTTTDPDPPAGSTCHWGSGGSCVSWATAEALFGWKSSDLLPCCEAGCAVGSACDVGWQRLGSKFAHQRVVGTCGPCADGKHHSCGECGNKTCDPGEYPTICPGDCKCGDGQCSPEEVGACWDDCGKCGDGSCDPGEAETCASDCGTCGDGWCSSSEYSLGTCGQDCWGACHDVSTYPGKYMVCGVGYCSLECLAECALPGTWVTVAKGKFEMGSPASESCRYDNEDQHSVTLTSAFELQSTEVTQAQFEGLMAYNPSHFSSCGGDCPVEDVSWHEAAAYCNTLSKIVGLAECYSCTGSSTAVTCAEASAFTGQSIYDCPGYRLPTEAEWEFAYRAGTTTAYYNGPNDPNACGCQGDANLDPIAWYCGNANSKTHPVGSKQKNAWNLSDMAGNVWEWCNDSYQSSLGSNAVTDPVGSPSSHRVMRGGSHYDLNAASNARAASRHFRTPALRYEYVGFRCARVLP